MPKYGAYSRDIVLARPDRRTKEARLLTQVRKALIAQLGGEPTPQQRMLIERAAMLSLRCAKLDEKVLDGTFSEFDAKTYLAFSNSLTRTMTAMGVRASAAEPPNAMDAIRRHVTARQPADAA